jgi:hypothetical protein
MLPTRPSSRSSISSTSTSRPLSILMASSTPRPLTASGARTDRPLAATHVSAVISTATGELNFQRSYQPDVNSHDRPYKWEVAGGASTNPCSETYKGVAAGDAPENRGLKAQVDSLKASRGIRLYFDVQYAYTPTTFNPILRNS